MSITRREFLVRSSAAVAFTAVPWRARGAGQATAPPATSFELIRRNVGVFTGRGGTIGWLSNGGALVVVDTQFPDTATICLEGLRTRAGRVPDLVINTHHHGDHTAGNKVFGAVTKRIVAHVRVPDLQKRVAETAQPPTTADQVYPGITFETSWSEKAGDERLSARHYGPAHTGGDAIVHFEQANVVHMGDLLFHERHPFIDRPAGASVRNWMKAVETIATAMPADTRYIAGHSKEGLPVIVGREALQKQRDYFDAVLSHVQKGVAAGRSKAEITALETLKGFEGYQSAPPRLTLASTLGVAYDELTESK